MVVFTCNHCGDSLQKPKVEKHYNFACRTRKSLTCVDCLKDFLDEDYASHTKCLTEEERYAAKGAYANGIVKKGELKQETWLEMIKSILVKENNLKPSVRNLLNTVSNCSNVPRKKPKFMNFIKSSTGGRVNLKDVEDVWNIIENYKASQNKCKEENSSDVQQNGGETFKSAENIEESHNSVKKAKKKKDVELCDEPIEENVESIVDESTTKVKKAKKRKHNEEARNTTAVEQIPEENVNVQDVEPKKSKKSKKNGIAIEALQENGTNGDVNESNGLKKKSKKKMIDEAETPKVDIVVDTNMTEELIGDKEKFNFKWKINQVLTSKGSTTLRKLEKKVMSAYLKHSGLSEVSPKVIKKYNKKLKSLENLEIIDNNVKLKTTA